MTLLLFDFNSSMVRLRVFDENELRAHLYFNSSMVRLRDVSAEATETTSSAFQFQYGAVKRRKTGKK